MDVATIAKTAVMLAGNLCGVPGVPVLADAIVTLIETCENIPKQKQVPSGYVFCRHPAYTASRRSIKDLLHRCMTLLDVLKAEDTTGPPTSKRLEGAIVDAIEWVVPFFSVIRSTDDYPAYIGSSLAWRSG